MRRWLLPAGLLALCSACEDGQVASKDAGRPRPDAQVAPLPQPVDGGLLVFVAPDRSADGDGSRARPLGSLVRAYEAVAAGDSVVLLAGDHGEVPAPPRGVRLVGEGTHATHVRGPLILDAAQTLEALTFHGALTLAGDAALVGVALQDSAAPIARVTGPSQWTEVRVTQITGPEAAVRVEAGGVLTWRGGGLHDLAGGAIHGEDAQLRLAGLDLSRFAGVGVALDDGTLEVDDLRMHAPVGAGVLITGGRATLSRVDVFDPVTDPVLNTASGFGVTGGEVTVSRSYVRGGDRAFRVAVQGRLQVVDCVADAPGADGLGVSVGAQGQATGLRVIRPRNAGLAVAGEGAVLGVADSVVERPGRIGLLVADGAHATTDGLTVTDAANRGVAVLAAGALLSGLVVERAVDVGVQITDATAEVRVEDSTLTDCGTSGLAATGEMAEGLTLRNLTVSGTYDAGFELAIGVHLYQTGALIEGLTSRENQGPGLQVEQSGARLMGATLLDNGGPGAVLVEAIGEVALDDLNAERNGGAGVLAVRSEATLTRPVLVANRAVDIEGPGDGASAFVQSVLNVHGGLALENAGSGLAASVGSTLSLADGVRLEGNQRYGAEVGCDGSVLSPPDEAEYAGNRLGDRNACP